MQVSQACWLSWICSAFCGESCYRKQRASDLVSLVFRERILSRILINATSNAESQNQIVTLTKLMYFNSLLKREKDNS